MLRRRILSPVEVAEATLARIVARDGVLHSYITVAAEATLAQARVAEREIAAGRYRGPLHGIPVAVKDLIYTRSMRTTCGSGLLADWTPGFEAAVIERLLDAGAVIVGKLTMTEFAGAGYHPCVPAAVNPWHPGRWAGASSSGPAVAVAAGLCFGALGSDTGGSLRHPAAACGVVSIKPTHGRVSCYGVHPAAEPLDTVGPMARGVADAAALLQTVAGFDARDPWSLREPVPDYAAAATQGVEGVRIGVDESYCTDGVDPEIARGVLAAAGVLERQGARLCPVRVEGIDELIAAQHAIAAAGHAAAHAAHYPARADQYGPKFRAMLEHGSSVSGAEYARALSRRQIGRRRLDDLLAGVDLLLCPAMAIKLRVEDFPPHEGEIARETILALHRMTAPYAVTGHPTLCLPCGFDEEGAPMGLQLVGRTLGESDLIRVAGSYERASEWHLRRPPDFPNGFSANETT